MTTHQTPCGATTFGYLSAIESAEYGFFGGYLLVSPLGRPLEFHCTAPVRPSRAQQILYGPTLQPYLIGEQIGGTLLGKAQLTPQIILTDQRSVLCLRSQIGVPLVLLIAEANGSAADGCPIVTPSETAWIDGDASVATDVRLMISGYTCELPAGYESDRARAIELLTTLATRVDLAEPFDRIHEAIREAQRIGERGPDAQAA